MARARSPNRDKAYEIYQEHKGEITNRAIADLLGEDEKVIAVWKSRDNWNVVQQSNECCTTNKKRSTKPKKEKIIPEESLVESVMANEALSDRQRLFCLYFIKSFNATKAYQKAYGTTYELAASNAHRVMANPKVKAEIERLKRNKLNQAMLQEEDIVQRYIDIAFANITDYASFDESGVRFKDSDQVDGSLISEVKQGRDGIAIKLLDQMKALDWLANHMDLATEEQRARIDKIKLDIDRAKGETASNPLAEAAKRMATRRGDDNE